MCSADRTRPQATPTSRKNGGRFLAGTRAFAYRRPRNCTCASPSAASSACSRDDQRRRPRTRPSRPASTNGSGGTRHSTCSRPSNTRSATPPPLLEIKQAGRAKGRAHQPQQLSSCESRTHPCRPLAKAFDTQRQRNLHDCRHLPGPAATRCGTRHVAHPRISHPGPKSTCPHRGHHSSPPSDGRTRQASRSPAATPIPWPLIGFRSESLPRRHQ